MSFAFVHQVYPDYRYLSEDEPSLRRLQPPKANLTTTKSPEHHTQRKHVVRENFKQQPTANDLCSDIARHVQRCKACQRWLDYNPQQCKELANYTIRHELFDIFAYIFIGVVFIIIIDTIRKF